MPRKIGIRNTAVWSMVKNIRRTNARSTKLHRQSVQTAKESTSQYHGNALLTQVQNNVVYSVHYNLFSKQEVACKPEPNYN